VRIELDAQLAEARPPPEVALTLYRAAQEGITNALRHGHARVRCACSCAPAKTASRCNWWTMARACPQTGRKALDGGGCAGWRSGWKPSVAAATSSRAAQAACASESGVPLPQAAQAAEAVA
jgi:hypothetical protein